MYFDHEIVSNKSLNKKFNLIRLKSISSGFNFKVGQFVTLVIDKNIFRAYSIASQPSILPFWEMFIDITPGGPGTTFLKLLKRGDKIKTLFPKGQFVLNKSANNYVFGATGCGLAPLIPMIEELATFKDKKIYLFWGLRNESDIILKNKLNMLSKINNNLTTEFILSKPSSKWKGISGHVITPLVNKAKLLSKKETKIYLSGSEEFVSDTRKALREEKISPNCIYFESCY